MGSSWRGACVVLGWAECQKVHGLADLTERGGLCVW